jgi:hypothetical protein
MRVTGFLLEDDESAGELFDELWNNKDKSTTTCANNEVPNIYSLPTKEDKEFYAKMSKMIADILQSKIGD